jgi:hypothetical protein
MREVVAHMELIAEDPRWTGARSGVVLFLRESLYESAVRAAPTVSQLKVRDNMQKHAKAIIFLYLLSNINIARYA